MLELSTPFCFNAIKMTGKMLKNLKKKSYLVVQGILLSYFCKTTLKRRKLDQFQQDQKQYNDK